MGLADDIRNMLRTDCLPQFVPDVANFRRVRIVGTENHLGEIVESSRDELDLFAIETTGRGKQDDEERTPRPVGGQIQGEIVIMLLEQLLEVGDRVDRISNGEVWRVYGVDAPQLNGSVVSYQYRIRRQTD